MDKFMGIGLTNALALWLFFILLTVVAKVVSAKYPVQGVNEVIQAV